MRRETDKDLLPRPEQNTSSLEKAGRGDCSHCSAIWCLETNPAKLLLPPLLQLEQQICDAYALLAKVSVSFHILYFSLAILEITKIYIGIYCVWRRILGESQSF